MIQPTVGRMVWYWERKGFRQEQPMGAIIAFVHSPEKVNLTVSRASGETFAVQAVELWQGDGPQPQQAHCQWMPYQVGQAAKTEDLQKKLANFQAPTI